ncbi:hypothetical protein AMTR_s00037p00128540, partial [Amborella trichopoda]
LLLNLVDRCADLLLNPMCLTDFTRRSLLQGLRCFHVFASRLAEACRSHTEPPSSRWSSLLQGSRRGSQISNGRGSRRGSQQAPITLSGQALAEARRSPMAEGLAEAH